MRCCSILLFLALAHAVCASENLLTNPGFENGTQGWSALWLRVPQAGTAVLDAAVKHAGAHALRIETHNAKEWSEAQSAQIPVGAGDILHLSAWVKCEKCSPTEIDLTTRRAGGDVIEWMAGSAGTSGTHDWKQLKRTFVVPDGCATVQFRLIGADNGTVWLDDCELTRDGNVADMQGGLMVQTLTISNAVLEVALTPKTGALTVTDKRSHAVWQQRPCDKSIVVTSARPKDERGLQLYARDVGNDLELKVSYELDAAKPELHVTLEATGPQSGNVAFPPAFTSAPGTWLVVPMNEGILYPVDDPSISELRLIAYGGHGISMPWFGVADLKSGVGAMAMLETPDDASIDLSRAPAPLAPPGRGVGGEGQYLAIAPLWEPSRGAFSYARKLNYVFFDQGGYVAQAKRYRAYAQATKLFKTLAEKAAENPNVDLLLGAANVWVTGWDWKLDKVKFCQELKALGMERVLWSGGGTAAEIKAINELGYLTGKYDIYQDVYPPDPTEPKWLNQFHAGWPEDLVYLPGGDWMRGWVHKEHLPNGTVKEFPGGVICSARQLARAQQRIPAELKEIPYRARFIDTTTASPWRECYNPAHPLTRSQDRAYKMGLLDYVSKDCKLVTGTETGIDPSVPYVEYYEGMLSLGPYRLPDSGYDMIGYRKPTPDFLKFQVGSKYRVPLWELVYHECVVAQWYWGDASNKAPEVWDQRDLINILYGTPPLYMINEKIWKEHKERFVQSYKNICPLVRELAHAKMLSHKFLTEDHSVQLTEWRFAENLVTVYVNFADSPYVSKESGLKLEPMGFKVSRTVLDF